MVIRLHHPTQKRIFSAFRRTRPIICKGDWMQTIRLDVDALEIRSFVTTKQDVGKSEMARTEFCGSAVSETNGVVLCKSCGPCCV